MDCDDDGSDSIMSKNINQSILITQEIFDDIILKPWLRKARDLILRARDDLNEATAGGITTEMVVSDVVLVGCTTRIPAIRRMIQRIFPEIELCTSLNPMSSVAQGESLVFEQPSSSHFLS